MTAAAVRDVLKPNPFKRQVFARRGDGGKGELYAAVGVALDRWERCQVRFAELYRALAAPDDGGDVALRAFAFVNDANSKRLMLAEAAQAAFHDDADDDLVRRVQDALALHRDATLRRNEIAHAAVMREARYKIVNGVTVARTPFWYLVPALTAVHADLFADQRPRYRFALRDVVRISEGFEQLGQEASLLAGAVQTLRDGG